MRRPAGALQRDGREVVERARTRRAAARARRSSDEVVRRQRSSLRRSGCSVRMSCALPAACRLVSRSTQHARAPPPGRSQPVAVRAASANGATGAAQLRLGRPPAWRSGARTRSSRKRAVAPLVGFPAGVEPLPGDDRTGDQQPERSWPRAPEASGARAAPARCRRSWRARVQLDRRELRRGERGLRLGQGVVEPPHRCRGVTGEDLVGRPTPAVVGEPDRLIQQAVGLGRLGEDGVAGFDDRRSRTLRPVPHR